MRSGLVSLLMLSGLLRADDSTAIAQRHYEGLINRGRVTAAAFASVDHGEVRAIALFGKAKPDSLWRAASTSKVFTAIGIMRLVEQGLIDPDVDVNSYIKSFHVPERGKKPITVRQLLSHTSGLDDPFVGSGFLTSPNPPLPLSIVMRQLLPRRVYDPNEVYLYSNFGYGLLGALIEDVTGRRFEEYMRHEVLDQMGMLDSTFQQPLPEELAHRVVPAIERTALGLTHTTGLLYHRSTAAGGLTTSVHDLIQLVRFVQGGGSLDGRQILRPETMDRMLGRASPGTADSESFGFASGVNRGQRYWYAGGDLGGYHVVVLWFPDHDRALVTTAASVTEMATWGLVPDLMEHWFGADRTATNTPSLVSDPKAVDWARQVAGIYRPVRYPHFDLAKTFSVTMDRVVEAGQQGTIRYDGATWVAIGPLRFQEKGGSRTVTFQADPTEQVLYMDRAAERIAWYQTGRMAIAGYFGFLILSIVAFFIDRRNRRARPMHWMGWAVLLHSVAWLGSVLAADPQRLILGFPWYLLGALGFGSVVFLTWLYLAFAITRELLGKSMPLSVRGASVVFTAAFAFYLPFIVYWRLTILPVLGINF